MRFSNELEIEKLGHYVLDNLFDFDRETGELHIYSLTNMAETRDHRAAWSDERTLKGEYEGLRDGKRFRKDFLLRMESAEEVTIDYIQMVDDKPDPTMSIRLKKKM